MLEGKNESYLMTVGVHAPKNGVNEALVIAGSDKRGTIYGIYELSETRSAFRRAWCTCRLCPAELSMMLKRQNAY